jgi:hypothetical protein
MSLAQVSFTVNVSKLSSSHTKEVAAFYVSVSKYATKRRSNTKLTHEFTMSYRDICICIANYIYIYVHVASGLTDTSTPDDGPKKRQES